MKKISILSSQEYGLFIENIKSKIRSAQVKASFSVNAELIRLYKECEKLPQPVAEIDGLNPPRVVAQMGLFYVRPEIR